MNRNFRTTGLEDRKHVIIVVSVQLGSKYITNVISDGIKSKFIRTFDAKFENKSWVIRSEIGEHY
jgi:hypothetical protein